MTRIIIILTFVYGAVFAQNDSLNYYFINSDYDKVILVGDNLISNNLATEKDTNFIALLHLLS